MRNKIVFLLNQREFEEADAVLQRLTKNNPDDLRTQFLQTKTLTVSGRFKQAVEQSESTELVQSFPETLYWRALANYQIGNNREAGLNAKRFLQTKQSLLNGAGEIVEALAGESRILKPPDKDAGPFMLLFPVEQAVYTGLVASQQMEIGRLETAARLFRTAFMMDNRNRTMLYQAVKVNALVGYVEDAQMFFDYSKSKTALPLVEDLERSYKNFRIASLTLHNDDLPQGGRKIDVARALAWSAILYLQEDVEKHAPRVQSIVDSLVKEYPHDVVLQVRKAAMFRTLKNPAAAMSIYQNLQQKFPNYTVLVRMAGVEGASDAELSARSKEFMGNLNSVTFIPPSKMRAQGCVSNAEYVTFKQGGSASVVVSVKERGSYIIMIVARGIKSGGMWPLVKILVDDKFAGVTYIYRENWDCYTLTVPLEVGTHKLELVYGNDMVDEIRNNAGRGFSLRAIYVALTGVTDVRQQ